MTGRAVLSGNAALIATFSSLVFNVVLWYGRDRVAADAVAMVTGTLRCDGEWKSSCNGRHVTPMTAVTSYMTSTGVTGRQERMSVDSCGHHHSSIGDYIALVL